MNEGCGRTTMNELRTTMKGRTMQDDSGTKDGTGWKPTRGWLGNKVIPRNSAGDPAFGSIEEIEEGGFSLDEVVYLVNKQLYALEYQRETHKNRAQAERDLLAPVKAKAKEMFPGTAWVKLTEGQVDRVMEALRSGTRTNEGGRE